MNLRLPPKQAAICAGCGRVVIERDRKPCPDCRSINRIIGRTASDGVGVKDKA